MKGIRKFTTEMEFRRVRANLNSLKGALATRRERDDDKQSFVELENRCDEAIEAVDAALEYLGYVEAEEDWN